MQNGNNFFHKKYVKYLAVSGKKMSSTAVQLFDADFYIKKYPDIASSGVDPYEHYVEHGIKERRWPSAYFCPDYYATRYASELSDITDIFSFFLKTGINRGHIPIPHFAPRWYLRVNEDIREAGINPYLHFIQYGDIEGRHPSPYFNSTSYLANLQRSSIFTDSALKYWLIENAYSFDPKLEAFRQLLADAGMLDAAFYLDKYKDVFNSGGDPVEHFILHGARELRSPNAVTDMRLINLVLNSDYSEPKDFLFYLKDLHDYNYDLEQNNYNLWKNIFHKNVEYIPGVEKLVSDKEVLSKVAVFLSVDECGVGCFAEAVRKCKQSIGCLVEVYVVPQAGLAPEILGEVRKLTKRSGATACIESEQSFLDAASGSDFILSALQGVVLDAMSIHIFIGETRRQDVSFMYSDHDYMVGGSLKCPDFKPKFSPTYLDQHDYCGPVLFAKLGDLTAGTLSLLHQSARHLDAIRERDVLRSGEYKIGHAPFVLYHVTSEPAGRRKDLPVNDWEAGHGTAIENPSVSIIIPMRDKHELTKACIESILTYTMYPRHMIEIIVVDNNSIEASSIAFLARLRLTSNVKLLKYKGAFNFAKINNYAVESVASQMIVFLNNDTVVIDGLWLKKLVYYAAMPDVGAVGAKLVYEDDTIQHGGCVVGAAGGYVEHLLVGRHYMDVSTSDHTREMSAITGACIAMETKKFRAIGGFQSVLRVAWNDVFLCLNFLQHGYRNIYLSDAILYHFESKSRGFDNTSEQKDVFAWEASFTRMHFRNYFLDDPSYNSNLSLESAGKLALPPRSIKPWLRGACRSKKVLMLSCVYNIGYGVPVVMERHARRMTAQGWDVHIGGPSGMNEIQFEGCTRAIFSNAMEAACYAYKHDISVIVSHTPPFFRVTDYVGSHVAVICYDYGEPNPKFFDATTMEYLNGVNRDKFLAFSLATKVVAISKAVKSEGKFLDTSVVGLGNDHLAVWSDTMNGAREKLREKHGWKNKRVILNVCRFPKTERYYKGLDKYVDVMNQFNFTYASQADDCVWVLAGAAGPQDVAEMRGLGLEVFSNLPNEELANLYKAVDVYMSFSKWEGYNLGIGQALAMGLPVAASDIEAHREFPIFTSNSAIDISGWLDERLRQMSEASYVRRATIFRWDDSAEKFETLLGDVFRDLVTMDTKPYPTHPSK